MYYILFQELSCVYSAACLNCPKGIPGPLLILEEARVLIEKWRNVVHPRNWTHMKNSSVLRSSFIC